MSQSRYFKIIVALSFLFIILPGTADAFFSPNNLQIVEELVNAGTGQVAVGLIATIISFGFWLKRGRIKNILISFLLLFVVILIIKGGFMFFQIREINKLSFISEADFVNIYTNSTIVMPKDRFINLDKIELDEYNSFKKMSLVGGQDIQLIDTNIFTSIFQLKENISAGIIDQYLKTLGINKTDKILAYCNTGWSSSLASYFLNQLGYNVYYAQLNKLEKKDYLKFERFPLTGLKVPVILPLKPADNDNCYVFFMFHEVEDEFCDISNYSLEIKNKLRKVVVWPEKTSEKEQCDVFKIEMEEIFKDNSKIVCLSKMDCILTQNYLGYLNLTDKFKSIFYIQE